MRLHSWASLSYDASTVNTTVLSDIGALRLACSSRQEILHSPTQKEARGSNAKVRMPSLGLLRKIRHPNRLAHDSPHSSHPTSFEGQLQPRTGRLLVRRLTTCDNAVPSQVHTHAATQQHGLTSKPKHIASSLTALGTRQNMMEGRLEGENPLERTKNINDCKNQ